MQSYASDARRSAIELTHVSRRFGSIPAVDDVSLNVFEGEIFVLVGPDGAGKTTLIRLMCAALEAESGDMCIDGVDVVREPARVQAGIGYMPQRFSLYPDLTVIENLRFYGAIFGLPRAAFAARANELLTEFSLDEFSSRRADELSGGMKQKLALACALIHSPSTILLDEPTAGVDPVSRRAFWRILDRINQRGTTIFVSTPYMDEAERATRVAFIAQGSIVTCGTPSEIKDSLAGEVVEVECGDRGLARRVLRDDASVRSIEVFGESLHALVDSAAQSIPSMQERLDSAGIRDAAIRKIPASLEDAFVARLVS
jgi:ABC-2 type transport system ATP-binding protein